MIRRFINLVLSNLIGQLQLVMVEFRILLRLVDFKIALILAVGKFLLSLGKV